jgi:rhomboid protease GluP
VTSRSLSLPMGRPILTYVLLAANALVFLAMTVAGGSTDTEVLIRFGAKVNALIAEGEVWRLFTSMFLHIGLMHLAFNSYALFALGLEVERLYGSARFLVIYLLAGLWGSLASFALGQGLSAGASGAIFGLLGVLVAFFLRHRDMFGAFGRQRLISLLGVVGVNLFLGITTPGIDNLAHLGGLLSGAALGWALAPDYQMRLDISRGSRVVDGNSLLAKWWVVLLALLLLAGGTYGAMDAQSQSAPALIYQGRNALQGGDVAAAEALFRQAVARDGSSAEAYFYLGVTLSQQDRFAEAAEAYQAVVRLRPAMAEAHWNLALAYVKLNRPADAVAEFQTYIALEPHSPEAARARTFIAALQAGSP